MPKAEATRPSVRQLECACCGGPAPALRQWWNQDTGYGLCARCGDWILGREPGGLVYVEQAYGKRGVHWDPDWDGQISVLEKGR